MSSIFGGDVLPRTAGRFNDVFEHKHIIITSSLEQAAPSHTGTGKEAALETMASPSRLQQVGVGLVLAEQREGLVVTGMLPRGAADRDGRVKPGDVLTHVDGVVCFGIDNARLLLLGEPGTCVDLVVNRGDKPLEIKKIWRPDDAETPVEKSARKTNKKEKVAGSGGGNADPAIQDAVGSPVLGLPSTLPAARHDVPVVAVKEHTAEAHSLAMLESPAARRDEEAVLNRVLAFTSPPSQSAGSFSLGQEQRMSLGSSQSAVRPRPESAPAHALSNSGDRGMCWHCGKVPTDMEPHLRRCGGCNLAKYCSPDCQRADWTQHKGVCTRASTQGGGAEPNQLQKEASKTRPCEADADHTLGIEAGWVEKVAMDDLQQRMALVQEDIESKENEAELLRLRCAELEGELDDAFCTITELHEAVQAAQSALQLAIEAKRTDEQASEAVPAPAATAETVMALTDGSAIGIEAKDIIAKEQARMYDFFALHNLRKVLVRRLSGLIREWFRSAREARCKRHACSRSVPTLARDSVQYRMLIQEGGAGFDARDGRSARVLSRQLQKDLARIVALNLRGVSGTAIGGGLHVIDRRRKRCTIEEQIQIVRVRYLSGLEAEHYLSACTDGEDGQESTKSTMVAKVRALAAEYYEADQAVQIAVVDVIYQAWTAADILPGAIASCLGTHINSQRVQRPRSQPQTRGPPDDQTSEHELTPRLELSSRGSMLTHVLSHSPTLEVDHVQLTRTLPRWQFHLQARYFRDWVTAAAARRTIGHEGQIAKLETLKHERFQALQSRIAQRMTRAPLVAAFHGWSAKSAHFKRLQVTIQRAVRKMMNQGLVMAWELWLKLASNRKRLRNQARRVVTRLKKAGLASAFARWHEHVKELATMKTRALKVAARFMHLALIVAFERWFEQAAQVRRLRTKSLKVVQRFMSAGKVSAFERWRERVQEIITDRKKIGNVLRRLMKRPLTVSFETWREHGLESKRMRSTAHRVVTRLTRSGQVSAFLRWCDHAQEARKMRAKSLKVLSRFMNTALVKALERWQEHSKEAKLMRQKTGRIILRFRNMTLVTAFERWQQQAVESGHLRTKARKIVQRLMNMATVSAFDRWAENTREAGRLRAEAEASQDRKQALMKKIVMRMANQCLSVAFEGWTARAEAERTIRVKALRVVARFMNMALVAAWEQWVSHVEDMRELENEQRDLEMKMIDLELNGLKVMQRLTRGLLMTSFGRWVEYSSEIKAVKLRLKRVMHRFMNLALVTSFEQWRHIAIERVRCRKLVLRVVLRMTMGVLAAAFTHLSHNVELRRIEREEAQKREDLMQRTVKRMLHMTLSKVLQRWQDAAVTLKKMRMSIGKVIGRWRNQRISTCLDLWICNTTERIKNRGCLSRVVARMMRRLLSAAFESYRNSVLEAIGLRALLTKILLRMRHRALAAVLARWVEALDELRTLREQEQSKQAHAAQTMKKVLLRMTRRSVSAGLRTWMSHVEEIKLLRTMTLRIMKRFVNLLLAASFARWLALAEEGKRLKKKGRVIVKRWLNKAMSASFADWLDFVVEAQELREQSEVKQQLLQQHETQRADAEKRTQELSRQVHEAQEAVMSMYLAVFDPAVHREKTTVSSPGRGDRWGGVGLVLEDPAELSSEEENNPHLRSNRWRERECVRIVDVFIGSAAETCRPVVSQGDNILRVDSSDVRGMSARQVRQLLDGGIGSAAKLTCWNRERSASYTVTLMRSRVPSINDSGNRAQLYAQDLRLRARDHFHDVAALALALSEEKERYEEHRRQAHAASEETRRLLSITSDEATDMPKRLAAPANKLQVQTEELGEYEKQVYQVRDLCHVLRARLGKAYEDVLKHQEAAEETEEVLQQARHDARLQLALNRMRIVDGVHRVWSRRCAARISFSCFSGHVTQLVKTRKRLGGAFGDQGLGGMHRRQWIRLLFFAAWKREVDCQKLCSLETVHHLTLQRLAAQNRAGSVTKGTRPDREGFQEPGSTDRRSRVGTAQPLLSPSPSPLFRTLSPHRGVRDTMTLYGDAEDTLIEPVRSTGPNHLSSDEDDNSPPLSFRHLAASSQHSEHRNVYAASRVTAHGRGRGKAPERPAERVRHSHLATAQLARVLQATPSRDFRARARPGHTQLLARSRRTASPEAIDISSSPATRNLVSP